MILAKRTLELACWVCLAVTVVAWLMIALLGDRWWLATVVAFAPRWLWLGPPLALAIPAIAWRRRALTPLVLAVAVVLIPIMGFNVAGSKTPSGMQSLRVLTCNIDGDKFNVPALKALLRDAKPDLVFFQECEDEDDAIRPLLPEGFQFVRVDELAVASRYPVKLESFHRWQAGARRAMYDGLHCVVTLPGGPLPVCCIHLLTPRWGLSEVLDRKRVVAPERSDSLQRAIEVRTQESASVAEWLAGLPGPAIIAGDFNMPPDSAIFRRYWAAHGNAFSQTGLGYGCTKMTPLFGLTYGLRIDHILLDPPWQTARCWVGPDVGSDHLPLLADLAR